MWQAGQQENKPVNRGSSPPAPSAPASGPAQWLQGWRPGVCNYCPQTSSVSGTQEPHTTYGRWPSAALPSRKPTVGAGPGWQGRKGVARLAGAGLCHPSSPRQLVGRYRSALCFLPHCYLLDEASALHGGVPHPHSRGVSLGGTSPNIREGTPANQPLLLSSREKDPKTGPSAGCCHVQ